VLTEDPVAPPARGAEDGLAASQAIVAASPPDNPVSHVHVRDVGAHLYDCPDHLMSQIDAMMRG